MLFKWMKKKRMNRDGLERRGTGNDCSSKSAERWGWGVKVGITQAFCKLAWVTLKDLPKLMCTFIY